MISSSMMGIPGALSFSHVGDGFMRRSPGTLLAPEFRCTKMRCYEGGLYRSLGNEWERSDCKF